ncbi:MAG: SpoIIE family protein phosphatase [Ignavibacteriae bacterium]|nr:SpoIIE family protein phosphatase [Ignavibacteriota bacterium]
MSRLRENKTAAGSYESYFEHAALFEFSKVINSSLDPKFIFSHILLTIMGKILSTKGMVVLEKERGTFAVETVKGFSPDFVGMSFPIGKLPHQLFSMEKLDAKRYPWVRSFKRAGVKILLPMFIADKPIGLLGFGERFSKKKLHAKEITYLRSLANISATAIEKSRTIIELQQVNRRLDRKIQELNTLFELGKEFGALLDTEKLVRLLVFSLLGQIGVNRYMICLKQGPDVNVVSSRVEGTLPQRELLRALTNVKRPTLVHDLSAKSVQDARDVLVKIGMMVVVPMLTQSECKGFIVLGEKLSHESFVQADLEFLGSLANLAIISMENARLFKEAIEKQKLEDELLIAREIQKGLLPNELPTIAGIDIAATNVSSKQVGGDYYDVIPISDGRYVIAIGDVSGKGTPAALLMANIQATIRALVPFNLPLNDLTQRVNDLMCENTGGDRFVTFFWGIIDVTSMSLSYVNAGHNYPYLIHGDGSVERLSKGGMILGVMKTLVPYEEATVDLRSGDILILFTDGVSEAMSKDSEEYGEQRMEAAVHAHTDGTAQSIISAVHEDIQCFTAGGPQSDDITMMVVKIVSSA